MAESRNAVVQRQQKRLATLRTRSYKIVDDLKRILAVQGIEPGVFASALGNAIIANPALADCHPPSLFAGVRAAIRDGICPDGREGVLVARKDKEVLYLPMKEGLARGFCQPTGAIHRCGSVHENDEVVELDIGIDPQIKIKPCVVGDRGDFLFCWSYIRMPDGESYVRVFNKSDVELARAKSRARSGPWVTQYARMAEKSVSKSHFNALRHMIPRNTKALAEGLGEVGIDAMLSHDPEFDDETVIDGTAKVLDESEVEAEEEERGQEPEESREARERPDPDPDPDAGGTVIEHEAEERPADARVRTDPAGASQAQGEFDDFELPDPAA